jgi:hypothetical protein
MRRPIALAVLSLAALAAAIPAAEAQDRRRPGDGLSITVRPRSFLDPGTVVPVGALSSPASPFGQTRSYVLFPPYGNLSSRYGQDLLPDPVTNGPFVGARNPFSAPGFP